MNLNAAIKKIKSENELCFEKCEGECGGYNYKDGKCYCADSIAVRALEEYIKIGTVEECREARERQRAKKIIVSHNGSVEDRGKAFCPNCGMDIHGVGMIGACFRCGQRLKWSDTP